MPIIGDKKEFALEIDKIKNSELFSYCIWIRNHPVGHKNDSAEIAYLQSFLTSLRRLDNMRELEGIEPNEILNFCKDFKAIYNNYINFYDKFFIELINVDNLISRDLAYSFDDFFVIHYRVNDDVYIVSKFRDEPSSFDYEGYTKEIVFVKLPIERIQMLSDDLDKMTSAK